MEAWSKNMEFAIPPSFRNETSFSKFKIELKKFLKAFNTH
jgi:rRNA maturation protein Nop10